MRRFIIALMFCLSFPLVVAAPLPANADIAFGVMANRGELKAQNEWTPLLSTFRRNSVNPSNW